MKRIFETHIYNASPTYRSLEYTIDELLNSYNRVEIDACIYLPQENKVLITISHD